MRTLSRRILRLEARFRITADTEKNIRLRACIEAGRRRVAEARSSGKCISEAVGEPHQRTGNTVAQILDAGRMRIAKERQELGSDNST